MQSSDFLNYFEKFPFLKQHFNGIYSIDTLPTKLPIKHFLICNTDFQKGEGIHWFCCVKTSSKFIEVFDSLGLNEIKQEKLKEFCKFQPKTLHFNLNSFQSNSSSSCGQFCVYFIINRMFNLDLTFEELLNEIFTDDINQNEKTVIEFCKDL